MNKYKEDFDIAIRLSPLDNRERTILNYGIEEGRSKALDEAIETSAKAICIGCGYLDGHKCTYKGANCGVSKPMLEAVVKALEQLKEGAVRE